MGYIPKRLTDKSIYDQKDYNPYPVRLDHRKKILKEQAWNNNRSLHALIKTILDQHIEKCKTHDVKIIIGKNGEDIIVFKRR